MNTIDSPTGSHTLPRTANTTTCDWRVWRAIGTMLVAAAVAAGCGGGGGDAQSSATSPSGDQEKALSTGATPFTWGDPRASQAAGAGPFASGTLSSVGMGEVLVGEAAAVNSHDVAALNGGGYAVATRGGVATFDASGVPTASVALSLPPIWLYVSLPRYPFYWAVSLPQTPREAAVAATADGGWVAAWSTHATYESTTYRNLYVLHKGRVIEVNTSGWGYTDYPSDVEIAGLRDGGFVVAWTNMEPFHSYAQPFDSNGQPMASIAKVNTRWGHQVIPAVAGLADGGYLVTWTGDDAPGGWNLYGQRFTADGQRVGAETRINATPVSAGGAGAPAVTALANGGCLVTWTSDDGDGRGIFAQRFDGAGNPAGGETRINTKTAGNQTSPAATSLSDGGYVVRWVSLDLNNVASLNAQRYDASGAPVGSETSTETSLTGNPQISGWSDGRFVVTWVAAAGIYAERFENALVGAEGRDRLVASDTTRLLFGLAGDDRLEGSAGDDTLDGGTGDDFMSGGPGNDTYIVDSSRDKVMERSGDGRDTVRSSISYAMDHNIEDLVLTGQEPIDGTGNALDNRITGNSAANRLTGGLGNDTLEGGAGADMFVFDSKLGPVNVDILLDFVATEDVIHLDSRIFRGLSGKGVLSAAAFRQGTVAVGVNDRIIYDAVTGALMYDADGAGGAPAVQFATLTGSVGDLTAANFVVI
jgi:Ca2+-binding RTX toxin-like protein